MKNKILFWLITLFVILNIADSITTIFILQGESNPVYHMFGSIYVVYILKLLIILVVIWIYKMNVYPSKFFYFTTLTILTYGCLSLLLAQIINIYGILNPVLIEEAAKLSTAVKVKQYFQITSIIYFIPVMFNLLVFNIYDKSLDKVEINKEYNKYKGWWKFW